MGASLENLNRPRAEFMKPVFLTILLVLIWTCVAPAGEQAATQTPQKAYSPFAYPNPTDGRRAAALISPYSLIRYDQPAQVKSPAPTTSSQPDYQPPGFAPYRSTSRSRQPRPAYLP